MNAMRHIDLGPSPWRRLLAGCCSSVKLDDKRRRSRPAPPTDGRRRRRRGRPRRRSRRSPASTSTKAPARPRPTLPRVVYFDFDSYVVKDEFRPIDRRARQGAGRRPQEEARRSKATPTSAAAANTTSRSARSAPRRSPKSLALLGAHDAQLEAVSFGKERPAAQGSDEAAWAKNRRAELNYR